LLKKRALLMQEEDSETERLIEEFKLDRHIFLQQRASTTGEKGAFRDEKRIEKAQREE
jgi:hypothetical protein